MRLFGSKDKPDTHREYHKHDTEHWDQPTLADKIESMARDGKSYDEIKSAVADEGYSDYWFTQALAQLRNEGIIERGYKSVALADDDGLSDWG